MASLACFFHPISMIKPYQSPLFFCLANTVSVKMWRLTVNSRLVLPLVASCEYTCAINIAWTRDVTVTSADLHTELAKRRLDRWWSGVPCVATVFGQFVVWYQPVFRTTVTSFVRAAPEIVWKESSIVSFSHPNTQQFNLKCASFKNFELQVWSHNV